ncbi:MAG: LAGLIDADG family homing endonuclease [Candidatus Bathyarchaeia archaeon]
MLESGCNITQSYECGQKLLLCQRSRVDNAIRFPTIKADGSQSSGEAAYVLRHETDEPLYEIFLHGGFSVKVTGSHSVMLLDDFSLKPRRVSELRPGDTVAVRWHAPRGKTLTQVRLTDLISSDNPELTSKLWVKGANLSHLVTEGMSGQRSRRRLSRGAAPLEAVEKISALARSDRLRWNRSKLSIPSIIEVSGELGRLLGYYAAEGCCTAGGVRLSFGPGERDYVDDAALCVEKVFQLRPRVYGSVLVFGGRLLSEVFKNIFRAGREAHDKAVPYIILNATPEVKMEFLRGYFRGDRMIRFSRRDQPTISAKTVSRRLVSDLLILFAQIGVFASVEHRKDGRTRTIRATGQTIHHSNRYYVIRISDRSSLLKLRSIVEDLYGCRLDYFDKPVRKSPPWYSVPRSLVMNARQAIRSGCPPSFRPELENFLQHGIYGYKGIPVSRLRRIVSKLNHNEDRRLLFLRNLIENNVMLLPIKKIERVEPSSRFVYDVEVADAHTFVGGLGPVLLHNTDGDPWGMHIAMVIISGSANAAHLRDLNTPDAKWFGVYATDIVEYKLPSDKLTELDIKRLYELKRDPRYEGKLWNREIETFMKIKKKAEQEAFSRYGLTYIVDEYLPAKLEMVSSE